MKRTIIKIDEELCNGCGLCVKGCHEGALQLIDGKARMISELYCDGLGACIGDCPEGAIELEEREAEAYDEIKTIARMVEKGEATIKAHLMHLKDHKQDEFVAQAIAYLNKNNININLNNMTTTEKHEESAHGSFCGCPGSSEKDFRAVKTEETSNGDFSAPSELAQWPVQLHLVNPQASYFIGADVLMAADCAAFAVGDFHNKFMKGKSIAIACPKLDSNMEIYVEKLTAMIDLAKINTLHVVIMEVPCCGGLLQIAKKASANATRKIPLKLTIIGLQGETIQEDWV
ncbi:MAG: 4Fe-4S binding protein [Bacteroidetes bacterium]|nr:4Fe-4S binding protein [Bacteroidota bacterium]